MLILYSSFSTISLYFELYNYYHCFLCYLYFILKYADTLPLHDQLNDNLHTRSPQKPNVHCDI